MITERKKEKIDKFIIELKRYYKDCSANYFENSNLPNNLNKEEVIYLNENLELHKIVESEKGLILNNTLKSKEKMNFSFYLLITENIHFEINKLDRLKKSVFMLLAEIYFNENDFFTIYYFKNLFKKNYEIKPEDEIYILNLYENFNNPKKLEKWMYLRFAQKLNDSEKFGLALRKSNELFTIISFKMKKPIILKFPNLKDIAVNAIQNYRENGDIILKAMSKFKQAEKIMILDQKKGTLKRKLKEYTENRPIQDTEFENIVNIIFPELK